MTTTPVIFTNSLLIGELPVEGLPMTNKLLSPEAEAKITEALKLALPILPRGYSAYLEVEKAIVLLKELPEAPDTRLREQLSDAQIMAVHDAVSDAILRGKGSAVGIASARAALTQPQPTNKEPK